MATSPGDSPYIPPDTGAAPATHTHPRLNPMNTLDLETLAAPFRELYTPHQASEASARLILKYGEDGGEPDDPDRDSRRLLIALLYHIGEVRP